MARKKNKLKIDDCIVIGDARRLEKGELPVKTMRGLSIQLANDGFDSANIIYHRLYRMQNDGYLTGDQDLIKRVKECLHVTDEELITEF